MALDKRQFKDLIERVLKHTNLYSESAVNLLLGTAAQESGFGTYIRQLSGPALGVFQMEPATEEDIIVSYLKYRPPLMRSVFEFVDSSGMKNLEHNLGYQIAMARVHYRRVPAPLPDDVQGMARYWKRHYNTMAGKGTAEEFVENYHRYVGRGEK